jgi:hypothetical protein
MAGTCREGKGVRQFKRAREAVYVEDAPHFLIVDAQCNTITDAPTVSEIRVGLANREWS